MAPVIAVSIVEDHSPTREAIQCILKGMPGFRFVSSHADTDDAIAHLPVNRVDVVLVDIGLRGASGIECLRGLKRRKPGIHVIMFTVHDDSDRIFDSLRSGASGYILKSSVPTEILDAIREVVNGGAPMTPPVARRVLQHFHRSSDAKAGLEQLTNREGEVLHHLSAGYTAKEIAEILHISFETVRNHIKSIYAKLQVGSRAEAVVKYLGH
jgi:DNA-binding NarL/FixJ family response regulator